MFFPKWKVGPMEKRIVFCPSFSRLLNNLVCTKSAWARKPMLLTGVDVDATAETVKDPRVRGVDAGAKPLKICDMIGSFGMQSHRLMIVADIGVHEERDAFMWR